MFLGLLHSIAITYIIILKSLSNYKYYSTVELVYSGHPSEAAKWLLYTGGLLIEVFNVYVAHEKFRWDFPHLCK